MTVEILAVGTELLLGDIVNTNAQYLASRLALLGFGVLHQTVVGDNPARLSDAISLALSRSDILITTGGLGPTGDDITRETVASVMGIELVLHEKELENIENFFQKTGRAMGENNKKQAMLPRGCIVFKNDWGTAPACAAQKDGKIVIMLPGPPREMKPIFEQRVKPYLEKYNDGSIESVDLRVFGISESKVDEMLSDLMQGSNPTLAPYAKDGEVLLRVTAKANNSEKALEMCRPLVDEVKNRLGDSVYGENVESLQQVVVTKLKEKSLKVGFAESCTGGLLAKRLTDIPGSSDVFDCGLISYANKIKQEVLGVSDSTLNKYGAVSRRTAAEMAMGARELSGADIGVGITGIAGPGGGTDEKPVGLVYVSVCDDKSCYVKRLMLGHGSGENERELIRYLAASNALDMIRRLIDGLPQTDNENGTALTVVNKSTGKAPLRPWMSKRRYEKKPLLRRIVENIVPLRGDSKREIIRKIALIISVIVFLTGLCLIISYYAGNYFNRIENNKLASQYESAVKAASSTTSVATLSNGAQMLPEFEALYKINPEIKGYIKIDKANISLPVVQTKDNTKYLHTDFEGNSSRDGTAFLDYRDSINPMSQNLIIYSHNMLDGQMFAGLENYASNGKNDFLGFYDSSPIISFNTLTERSQWKIFAVFVTMANTNAPGSLYYLNTNFGSAADFNNFIKEVRQRSFINTAVDVKSTDTLLTLSTCNYDYPKLDGDYARLVVMARKLRPGESTTVAPATRNDNVVYPQPWKDYWHSNYVSSSASAASKSSSKAASSTASKSSSKATSSTTSKSSSKATSSTTSKSSSKAASSTASKSSSETVSSTTSNSSSKTVSSNTSSSS